MTADVVRRELAEHERVIARGLKTFVEVGSALMDIRDARLYRDGYDTFEDYCERRWSLSRKRAYDLIGAAGTVNALSQICDTPVPATESHARELAGLEPEQAAEVMTKVVESGEKVTAAKIREVREQVAPRPVAKVTETERTETKVESYVDTDTGEVVEATRAPEAPAKVAAQAMREARNEPWSVLTTKIHADLLSLKRWIADRGVKALVDNRDAIAIGGVDDDCDALIVTLRELGALGDALDAETHSRRRLRSVQ